MQVVYCVLWEESERGWGVRPDGYSLHLSEEYARLYIDLYNANLPDAVPDVYSRPRSRPYRVFVDEDTFNKIKQNLESRVFCPKMGCVHDIECYGIRSYKNDSPSRA